MDATQQHTGEPLSAKRLARQQCFRAIIDHLYEPTDLSHTIMNEQIRYYSDGDWMPKGTAPAGIKGDKTLLNYVEKLEKLDLELWRGFLYDVDQLFEKGEGLHTRVLEIAKRHGITRLEEVV